MLTLASLDTPRIALEIKPLTSPPCLSVTLPYWFALNICRQPDSRREPCVIKWNAYNDGLYRDRFILLQETQAGFKRLDVKPRQASTSESSKGPLRVSKYNSAISDLHELGPSGAVRLEASLPHYYQSLLIPGERYRLDWPGAEIEYWAWGSRAEIMNTDLDYRGPGSSSPAKLIPPESEGFVFTVKEEEEPWPRRQEVEAKHGFGIANQREARWRQSEAERRRVSAEANGPSIPKERKRSDSGAPVLDTVLEAPADLFLHSPLQVNNRLTYKADDPNAKSITFHTTLIHPGFRLARRNKVGGDDDKNANWEPCGLDGTCGYVLADGPDVRVNVSNHEDFVSLLPGETWTYEYELNNPTDAEIPHDTSPGHWFKFWFVGIELDWWDWGSAEDHAQTEVSLPCYIKSGVVDPRNNGGRPTARLTNSDAIEFIVKG